jgi:hypothetical protein
MIGRGVPFCTDDSLRTVYTSGIMEAYHGVTRKVINQFLGHRISFAACVAALDAALAKLIPRLKGKDIPALRALMLANNATVMTEMERRGPQRLD